MSQSTADAPDNARGAKRKLESRKRLLAAARQLFVARGYHETRPQDISKAAGLGHGTFYLHFKDKRECFLAFVDEARTGWMPPSLRGPSVRKTCRDGEAALARSMIMPSRCSRPQ
jgi:AcrR family transcriptional regulator